MRLSQGVEWAVHCCLLMAWLPPTATVSATTLAEYHGVPRPYLAKALQALSRAGLVATTAGRSGGYRLARRPQEITLFDVVNAVEGDQPAFRCTEIRQNAPFPAPERCYRKSCGVAVAMWRAEQAWRDSLAEVTIAALVDTYRDNGPVPPAVQQRNADWLTERTGQSHG
ncbi:RrF2 family transcriptional regulator [Nakamurella aerolata]|uniref:Rrf2 family transcriptional regulator n=1 Tax=Nakamurella aerolata TaxID=1656892 RepID=A0A849A7K8_9ACTN|nr:Rrf2 family transcriptional regulator [Nakamurella aerolata]NNG36475.1 Rrf2 family transcriptional regulator [Nakamurella aerolata]